MTIFNSYVKLPQGIYHHNGVWGTHVFWTNQEFFLRMMKKKFGIDWDKRDISTGWSISPPKMGEATDVNWLS